MLKSAAPIKYEEELTEGKIYPNIINGVKLQIIGLTENGEALLGSPPDSDVVLAFPILVSVMELKAATDLICVGEIITVRVCFDEFDLKLPKG